MNEEFSGGGQGAGARENKGWDHWEGFARKERACDGSSKMVESGRKGGNYLAMFKICNRKMAT